MPRFLPLCLLTLFLLAPSLRAQEAPPLDRVLTMTGDAGVGGPLAEDRGAGGLWQRLLKLRTTASVLQTTAHPDDEQAGVLTYLGRGEGARTALLTLNRGEGGANAVGPELFDALGLVRTEELRLAGRYYGLDDQYFTSAIDYGFSKTLDEALRNWGRENVLRDMVRVIRLNRPLVVVSRFHGSPRDGHGHHQAAGGVTPDAVRAAGDSTMFPEQITEEGLRPWAPRKLYRGGVRPDEPWHVMVDAGGYSPWLGETYQNFGMYGLSLQRSQTGGRTRAAVGPQPYYYERLDAAQTEQEGGLFDGLDTSIAGIFDLTGEPPPANVGPLLAAVEGHVSDALEAFRMDDPAAVAPHLIQGLQRTRNVLALIDGQREAAFLLRIKERQFMDAINAALGVGLTAVAVPQGSPEAQSPWAPPPTMGPVVPGQRFAVEVTLVNPATASILPENLTLEAGPGWRQASTEPTLEPLHDGMVMSVRYEVQVPDDAEPSRPYYARESLAESLYRVREPAERHRAVSRPRLVAVAQYDLDGVDIELSAVVRTREAQVPYGYVMHELKVAPALAVDVQPATRVVHPGLEGQTVDLDVELVNNSPGAISGVLWLEMPGGWEASPRRHNFEFDQAGARKRFTWRVQVPALEARDYEIRVVATAGGRAYREGYQAVRHRDLDVQYLYRPSTVTVRGIDAEVVPDLRVGYVMGVGDEVPSAIEQLGATVHLLTAEDLAAGELARFDVIVVGTRAYAVREDLVTYNRRLLDYARAGGHLVVLYQTPEFDPGAQAPLPATLPGSAEEVSEEDAPVRILAPEHPVFAAPNVITEADFDGWIEQRGSKFFSSWDEGYTALVEMHDAGQEPQQGAWLIAPYGEGIYTYCALAFHRQLPYGVPGAYRLFANLLSLGQRL